MEVRAKGRRVVAPLCPALVLGCTCAAAALSLAGCDGPQSALAPAGRDAERISVLFWWMAGGAALVWLGVVALAVFCVRVDPSRHDDRAARLLIIGGGTAVPTLALAALLGYGLSLLPDLLALPAPGGLVIAVSGEQWWWRVRYHPPAAEAASFELANEIRLPVGERLELRLSSPDVIHSFWVPSLAGKVDMVPGRVTRIALEPTRTGVYRGACAEYCGASHALMAFDVVVVDRPAFAEWMERQARPAQLPVTELARRGQVLFLASGCGACHTVRGTPADGVVGPDLTHVASRPSIAAGTLPSTYPAMAHWIAEAGEIKPDVHMPGFDMLPAPDIAAIAAYLEGLE